MKRIVPILTFLLLHLSSSAQTARDQFESFKSRQEDDYKEFADKIDEDFADFLRNNWEEFGLTNNPKSKAKPKPNVAPKIDTLKLPDSILLKGKALLFKVPKVIELEDSIALPVHHDRGEHVIEPAFTEFKFFGYQAEIEYDPRILLKLPIHLSPNLIADFWLHMTNTDYYSLLSSLEEIRTSLKLNDFGFYLLVKKFTGSLNVSNNQQVLYTWFLMSKSKYKVKVGYNEDHVFMLLSSKARLYGLNYYSDNGVTYYAFGYDGKKAQTYPKDYPRSYKTVEFSIEQPLELVEDVRQRDISFRYSGKNYDLTISYNQNTIAFYEAHPDLDLNRYFLSTSSLTMRESVIKVLSPILGEMPEREVILFLLSMVQLGFDYQIDEEQFGYEKVFFPEQILAYEFSDCEDRSIFFSYLVKTLTGNKVIGLDYNSHVATAVNLSEDKGGDHYLYKGNKYFVCDPTYINAPIGIILPNAREENAKIIPTSINDNSKDVP